MTDLEKQFKGWARKSALLINLGMYRVRIISGNLLWIFFLLLTLLRITFVEQIWQKPWSIWETLAEWKLLNI